jgi:hypothetical protein
LVARVLDRGSEDVQSGGTPSAPSPAAAPLTPNLWHQERRRQLASEAMEYKRTHFALMQVRENESAPHGGERERE